MANSQLGLEGYGSAVPEAFFDELSRVDESAFRALGVVRRHHRGAYLMLEGDRNDHVLVLRAGRLKIVRNTDDGREVFVALRRPVDLIGELNALAGSESPRAASVVALDDVTVQSVAAEEFLTFVADRPAVSFALMRQLAGRLREATERISEAAGYDSLRRVARFLVEQADRHGEPVEGGVLVVPGLSQADLAGAMASSSKSVARALAILRGRGLIRTARRSIVIVDVEGLRHFVH